MNLKGKNQINKDFNFSSITDIVFLLLIFFMIASSLAKSHDTVEVKLPNAKGKTENKNSISVTIDRNINFFLNGVIVEKSQIEKEILGILTKENRSIILFFYYFIDQITDIKFLIFLQIRRACKLKLFIQYFLHFINILR